MVSVSQTIIASSTPAARNWFFAAENFVYWMSSRGVEFNRAWAAASPNARPFAAQMVIALVLGAISSWLGLWFGTWLTRVKR